jgi:hypothetical protein
MAEAQAGMQKQPSIRASLHIAYHVPNSAGTDSSKVLFA